MGDTYLGDIGLIRHRVSPIMPLVYSDTLSHLETLGKITQKTNEVITKVNGLQLDILEQANTYTDNAIANALKSVDNAVNEVNLVKREIEKAFDDYTNLTNSKLLLLGNRIDSVNKRIDDVIISINERTDLAIKQNNEYILKEVSKFLSRTKVVNYFTGASVTVQEMFDYLSLLHVGNSLTYDDLIDKNITYTELANLLTSYTNLVLNGGIIFN